MSGIITEFYKKAKRMLNEKGQDIVEFALLCAFCVGIALVIRDSGFSGAIKESYNAGKPELLTAAIGHKYATHDNNSNNQQQSEYKTYLDYFNIWHDKNSTDLGALSNDERKKADQLALQLIAAEYIGKTPAQILDQMNYFSNDNFNNYKNNLNEGKNGYSAGVLVPLSYSANTLDNENGHIWFEKDNNYNTVKTMTNGEAEVYRKDDANNPWSSQAGHDKRTISLDRLFYSDDMLGDGQKTVGLRLHYTGGVVDEVIICARKEGWNSKGEFVGEDLCINVTGPGPDGYTVNHQFVPGAGKKDPVRDPWAYLN